MKKIILFSLMLVCGIFSQIGKNEDDPVFIPTPNHIYYDVEVMPEYQSGLEKLRECIAQNYKNPKTDRWLKGQVMLEFIVEKNGSLSDIKVLRDLGYGTGTEAVRVLKLTGKWKPGLQNGEPVRVRSVLPIKIYVEPTQE